jgi:hypothetical protein
MNSFPSKYFPINTLDFEKMSADDGIGSVHMPSAGVE